MTKSKPLRVVVFVSGLGSGGAERTAVNICGWLRDVGHHVSLLTLSSAAADFYPCPQGVKRVGLDLQRPSENPLKAITMSIRRLAAIRQAVRSHHADAVLSLGDRSNVLMLLATMGLSCRKVISERADPLRQPLSTGWNFLRRMTYPLANLHVAQSNFVSKWLSKEIPALKSTIIGNASSITTENKTNKKTAKGNSGFTLPIRFIAIGRFSNEKGFDLLLDAFDKTRKSLTCPITLDLVGDGDGRTELALKANTLELDGMVTFLGRLPDVQASLESSDIFVLSSRCEGFPNVMIEAMSVGLPVIASRCPGGVEDILGDTPGRYALDYPPGDVEALAACMAQMAKDGNLRNHLARAGLERAADYHPDKIAAAWCNAVLPQ